MWARPPRIPAAQKRLRAYDGCQTAVSCCNRRAHEPLLLCAELVLSPPRRNPSQRWVRAALFLAGVGLLPAAQAAGVQVAELRAVIPAGRLGSTEPPAAPGPWSRRLGVQDGAASNGPSLYWLGDYRFAPSWGLRATGGLLGRLESAPPSEHREQRSDWIPR